MKRTEHPVFQILQQRSDFFCPAKWTELYLYLNHGNSNSCHHPIPHHIPSDLLADPAVLHNTPHKLKMQQLMLDGHRPKECHMCWHQEDLAETVISDRLVKAQHWKDWIAHLNVDPQFVPPFIEVVFDNLCNLRCSYCDGGQSSTWASTIKRRPLKLITDQRRLYQETSIRSGHAIPEYLDAWQRWWQTIGSRIMSLKISGGEPLLSPHFWTFLDSCHNKQFDNLWFQINTNFSLPTPQVQRFIAATPGFQQVTVAVSLDATGHMAEFARQNLDYDLLLGNIDTWLTETPRNCNMYLQATVNIFTIWGLREWLDLCVTLREQRGDRIKDFYVTLVRFPEFQSVSVLPTHLRDYLADDLAEWLTLPRARLSANEVEFVRRVITYLRKQPETLHDWSNQDLIVDFRDFLQYYNAMGTHNYRTVFPKMFVDWIDSL